MRKEFGEKSVELGEIGDLCHEYRSIYDQVKPTGPSPQNGIEIFERLPSLNVKAETDRIARRRVNPRLTRYEQQARCADCLGIGPDGLQSRNLDRLFVRHRALLDKGFHKGFQPGFRERLTERTQWRQPQAIR